MIANILENFKQLKREQNQPAWQISDVMFACALISTIVLIFSGVLLFFCIDANAGIFSAAMQLIIAASSIITVYWTVSAQYKTQSKNNVLGAFGIDFKNFKRLSALIFFGLASLIFIIAVLILIRFIFSVFSPPMQSSPYVGMERGKIQAIMFFSILVSPFSEEIFFRGFLQPALIKKWGIFCGIFITAFIFSVAHTQYIGYDEAAASVFAIGIILGCARQLTGSTIPCITAHLLNNIFAVINLF